MPKEIAFREGFITAQDIERLIAERYANNDYGRYADRPCREWAGTDAVRAPTPLQ